MKLEWLDRIVERRNKLMFLKDNYQVSNLTDNTLEMNQKISQMQKSGQTCINAAIGMLLDDDKHLVSVPYLDEMIKSTLNEETKRYGSITGGTEYQQVVAHWVLKDRMNDFKIGNIATPGGTGAINMAVHNYVNNTQHVFIPSPHWVNYDKIIKLNQGEMEEYVINPIGQPIDFDKLFIRMSALAKQEQRLFFILNDPGQNPTGYSLSKEEYIKLVNYLQELGKSVPVVLLVDYAYADYSTSNDSVMNYLPNDMSFLTLVAVSFSKTLSIYGLRLGSLLAISSKQESIDEFNEGAKIYARATWSSMNNNLIKATSNMLSSDKVIAVQEFLNQQKQILTERANLLINGLKEKGYIVYPYKSGFFVTVYRENDDELLNNLCDKHVFCFRLTKDCFRISIASISKFEIQKLLQNLY